MNPSVTRRSLTTEEYREYEFPNGKVYRINKPRALFMRPDGTTHRVLDSRGTVHTIAFPADGVILRWKPKAGAEAVSF